ncbi:MAG: VWA domain-containing protein [Gemmatimonadetes bacterium]|nr:VWA domain-containing protein [Gemmatimonadota bacterium]
MSLEFTRPLWLVLLAALPFWYWWIRPRERWGLLVARGDEAGEAALSLWLARCLELLPPLLRGGGVACLMVVLADPQLVRTYEEPLTEGVAIAVAIDLSTSMGARDISARASRLQAAKGTVLDFLEGRSDDVAVVAFGGEALTRMPLTRDHYVVREVVNDLDSRLLLDGTDLAAAITAGAGLLRDAPHRSKMLILLTDGAHNGEGITPALAARAAAAFDVRIYPIAIGTDYMLARDIDEMETVLTQAAVITNGRYFRATDVEALELIYEEIDRLAAPSEEVVVRTEFTPLARWFLLASVPLLLLGALLRGSRWGVLP